MAIDPYYVLGLDLGQSEDPSALCLLEFDPFTPQTVYRVRGLRRYPLGTPYTDLPAMLESRLKSPPLQGRVRLAVDATGVGAPVVELFRERLPRTDLYAVTITGGVSVGGTDKQPTVPKQDLISTTSVILAEGRLRIATGMREGDNLSDELLSYQRTTSERGHHSYNAPSGQHDDLVIALSIALWLAEHRRLRDPTIPSVSWARGEIPGIVEMGQGLLDNY